jgi:antitoxin VapB
MSRVQETDAVYRADPPPAGVRAKLFPNGRSQAVRLPKEFRMPGTEVLIHREGDRVVLEPIRDVPRDANGWQIGFWEELDALGEGVDFPDIDPMPVRFLEPEEFEAGTKPHPKRRP